MTGTFLPPGHAPLKFSPLADLFPMLSDKELDELGDDIAQNGQVESVKLFRGAVLDGRNRYTACARKNVGVRTEIFTGTEREALNFVCSKNLTRRHLAEHDRLRIAANMQKLKFGSNRFTREASPIGEPMLALAPDDAAPEPAEKALSQSERAELLHVSKRSLERADTLYDKGAPELKAAFESGAVAVSIAAEIAERPVEEQKAILAQLPRDEGGKLTAEAKKEIRKVAKEVRAEDQEVKKKKRDENERKLGAKIRALPDVKAGLIISDFEWHFKVRSEETGMDRHASNHYVTAREAQTPEAIVERQRERMSVAAEDCLHLMWCPASFLSVAMKVIELQGFKYVSQIVWIKPGIGTGFWIRDCHEVLLICVRGNIPCPAMGTQFDSAIAAPKGEHSEKPDFAHQFAEKFFPTLPKVEFNARRARAGWIPWGNEAPEPAQGGLGLMVAEENCPGHVASAADPKVCGRCGVHIDSLRPDDDGQGAQSEAAE